MGTRSRQHDRSANSTWYTRAPEQLARVRQVVASHESNLVLRIDKGRVLLEGKLRYDDRSRWCNVRITLADDHPRTEPKTEDIDGRFPKTVAFHKFQKSDQLCLWFGGESEWTRDGKALDAYLDQVIVHVDRMFWCEADPTHTWPGSEHGHTYVGALRVLLNEQFSPNLASALYAHWSQAEQVPRYAQCPCDSGKKWKWCHETEALTFLRRNGGGRILDRLHTTKT